ncbi:MAG: HAD hydrolase-like protein [Acidimicrobiia bacterium]
MRTLVLWDIDGTLMHCGPVGAEALVLAVTEVSGSEPAGSVVMSGKTDRQILSELLELAGVADPHDDEVMMSALDAATRHLAGGAHRILEEGELCPGVDAVVTRLAATGTVAQTLLTGNLAANARVKVSAFELHDRIEIEAGAYGDDHLDRGALVPVALARARQHFGQGFDLDHVWIVGDTPRDLECARAGGVRCLLVATNSHFELEELAALEPDAVLDDLADADRVVTLLTS